MPEWGWIIIFAVAVPLVCVVAYALLKRGGSIGIGKNTLTIPAGEAMVVHGDRETEGPLGKALHYVPDNISLVHSLIYGYYLRIVKSKGIAEDVLTEIEDSRFARALLRNATSLGNGSNSVQKIIESQIASQDFMGRDLEHYVRSAVVPRAVDAVRNVINNQYDSIAHYAEYSTRGRIVSQVEFVDMLLSRDFQDALVKQLVPFFEYAESCLDGGRGK